jgi:hypothetical protein
MATPYTNDPVTLRPVQWREKRVVEQVSIYNRVQFKVERNESQTDDTNRRKVKQA